MAKHIVLDDEKDKLLVSICDAALRYNGMQTFGLVNQLIAAIQETSNEQ